MSQENVEVEVVRRFLDALLRGDMDALLAETDPAIEIDDRDITLDTDRYRGHDGLFRWLEVWGTSWESWRVEDLDIRPVESGRVIALFVMCVTGKGSGVELDRRDAATFRLHDAKVVEIAYYNDQRQALEAVGLHE